MTSEVVHLPGTKLTPEVALHRTLNKVANIKAVAIVIQWNDETFDVDWSLMRASDLCTMGVLLQEIARRTLCKEPIFDKAGDCG